MKDDRSLELCDVAGDEPSDALSLETSDARSDVASAEISDGTRDEASLRISVLGSFLTSFQGSVLRSVDGCFEHLSDQFADRDTLSSDDASRP